MTTRGNETARLPGERALIHHIRQRLPAPPSALLVGPGDDAAVFEPERGAFQVITTDALVEGIHFDRRFSSPADIGYRAIAVNVSDVAAMGARPEYALLSFVLPEGWTMGDLDGLLDGVLEAASEYRVAIAGGNISRSPGPLVVDVTATGSVRPRKLLRRDGGKPGDALYVTGTIAAAAAGLGWLRTGSPSDSPSDLGPCVRRYLRPQARVRMGLLLGRNKAASACMDLSDGLADAVRQIAEASGTGALIDAAALPIESAASTWFTEQGVDPVEAALAGGDDYELLFAVPRRFRGRLRAVQSAARGLPVTRIGELMADRAICLTRDGAEVELPKGYSHF
ncbi:MAG TPA: thiamine-phosphate kinase [Vicinamibacterales bacterium]